jgi:hypothetical protein
VPNKALVAVDREEEALLTALARYEREMIEYGFRAVQSSLNSMQRFHAVQSDDRVTFRPSTAHRADGAHFPNSKQPWIFAPLSDMMTRS